MKRLNKYFFFALFVFVPLAAFAVPKPELYNNKYLQEVGSQRAARDTNECSVAANDYVASSESGVGRDAVRGAAKGAAYGALAATIMNQNAGRGAGAGAALSGLRGVGSAAREKKDGSPEYRKYVEACLEDRGYKVIGWKAAGERPSKLLRNTGGWNPAMPAI